MKNVEDLNLFMECQELNKDALMPIPEGYHVRTCRKDELTLWKGFPFDTKELKEHYLPYMDDYFKQVYEDQEDIFYKRCLFLCDTQDKPVVTCFAWPLYDRYYTIHWFKVLKEYEGQGLGRALLSEVFKTIPEDSYPVYLHTQPGSYRAIKLYSDFGFFLLTDSYIGHRKNELEEGMDYLKDHMQGYFNQVKFKASDGKFSNAAKQDNIDRF